MKKLLGWLALLLALNAVQYSALAQEVVLTGNEARAPKVFNDSEGNAGGVLIEIMKYVAQETGEKFSFRLYPFARAYDQAVKGNMGIIGLSVTAERLALFDYSKEPLFYDDVVLVVRAGKEFPFETLDDLKGKKIGVPRGSSFGELYEKAIKDQIFQPIPGPRPNSQLAMLLLDRMDAVMISMGKVGLEEALKGESGKDADLRGERTKFVILPKPFARDPNHVAFAKSMHKTDFLARVDQALSKGHQSGAIARLIDQYVASRK